MRVHVEPSFGFFISPASEGTPIEFCKIKLKTMND
jgi:hypothetical protein